jgi:hypothetical protein
VRAKPFIIGFFAVVALLGAASVYLAITVEPAEKTFTAVVAPDAKFKAVKITLTRSGSPPFCLDSIAVILGVYPDDFAERDKAYEVYTAPCGRFAGGAPSPKIEWLSNTALQISYAKNSSTAKPPKLKDADVTKAVHVTFVARD